VSLEKYPRLDGWLKRCKATMPDYEEINGRGIEMMKQFYIEKFPNAFATLY
jgi:hypothetical protein